MHDIGCSAFSQSWELAENGYNRMQVSLKLVDVLFEQNSHLFPELHENDSSGIKLVKALITGKKDNYHEEFPSQYNFIFEVYFIEGGGGLWRKLVVCTIAHAIIFYVRRLLIISMRMWISVFGIT